MRRRVLCGCWARLAFPRAREKKALVVVVAKIERPVNRTPARLALPQPFGPGRGTTTFDASEPQLEHWDLGPHFGEPQLKPWDHSPSTFEHTGSLLTQSRSSFALDIHRG